MGGKAKITVNVYTGNSVIRYKLHNRRMLVVKIKDSPDGKMEDTFKLIFHRLMILSDDDKKAMKGHDCPSQFLINRDYSKYCILRSEVILSRIALDCISYAYIHWDKIFKKS